MEPVNYEWIDTERKADILFLKVAAVILAGLYSYAAYEICVGISVGIIGLIDAVKTVAFLSVILLLLLFVTASMGESFVLPRLEGTYLILPDPHWYNLFSKTVFDINEITEMELRTSRPADGKSVEAVRKLYLKDGRVIDLTRVRISPAGRRELKTFLLRRLDGRVKIISS